MSFSQSYYLTAYVTIRVGIRVRTVLLLVSQIRVQLHQRVADQAATEVASAKWPYMIQQMHLYNKTAKEDRDTCRYEWLDSYFGRGERVK